MIDIEIEDEAWTAALPEAAGVVQTAAVAALAAAEAPEGAALNVLLTSDAEVRELNERFRGKDKATNVLSFPAPEMAAPHLGDIALAYGVCATEADEQGKPLSHHLSHLVAHGVLHLLGWDHEIEREAEEMEALERRILSGLDIPDPYGPTDGTP